MLKTGFCETIHGRIAWADSGGEGPVVLFIHGNSSCKEMFGRQLVSELGLNYRMIAFDLPGHGASSNAPDPALTYSIHGFADAAIALLAELKIDKAVVVGWSRRPCGAGNDGALAGDHCGMDYRYAACGRGRYGRGVFAV